MSRGSPFCAVLQAGGVTPGLNDRCGAVTWLRALQLRRDQTQREQWLGRYLLGREPAFYSQVPARGWILDFYCPDARLAVELDGGHHAEQRADDAVRDRTLLESFGILTVRIENQMLSWGHELFALWLLRKARERAREGAWRRPASISASARRSSAHPRGCA